MKLWWSIAWSYLGGDLRDLAAVAATARGAPSVNPWDEVVGPEDW